MHVSFYRTGSKPYLVSSHQTVILRKLFSLSPEVYGWERFRVLHSDVYLYSKTGNIFVIYIYRCQYITNIFNCFRIKQKTIWHFANLITAVVQSWTLLSLFISIIIIHHGIIWMMFLSALYPTKVNLIVKLKARDFPIVYPESDRWSFCLDLL